MFSATNLHIFQLQFQLPSLFLSLLLPGTHQLGETMLLLWQSLLSLILTVNLTNADRTAPRPWRAQEGRRAVAPAVVVTAAAVVAVSVPSVVIAAALVLAVAFLVVVASIGPDQWRVTHAADDVFHAGTLGTKMLV